MAEQLKAFRLASLEEWRTRSFGLGGPLGHLLTRTFEVITTVIRDGVDNEHSLPFALESLGRERDHAMSRDELRDDPVRALIYGLSDFMKTMVDSIREERVARGGAAGGGVMGRSMGESMGGAMGGAMGGVPVVQRHETVEELEEWTSSSSDDTLPLFNGAVKREEPETRPTPSVAARSSFDLDDFDGAGRAGRPITHEDTHSQPRSFMAIKRCFSEDPAAAQTPVIFKKLPAPATDGANQPPVLLHGCEVCDRFFESERGLIRHSFTHSAPRCTICNKCVSTEKMQKHMKEKHYGRSRRSGKKNAWDDGSDDDDEATKVTQSRKERAATAGPADTTEPQPDASG
ncbi:hypothetical protein PMAYCL1PPCAC_21646, partial [Pristionchus mayeri]